jgi:two-component system sensor histidine kinase CreC
MRISELESNFSATDLLQVANRAIDQAAEAARNANVTLVLVCEGDVAEIRLEGVEDLMVLAVFNLLSNAISFSKAGDTVTVTVTVDAKIRVSDEGPGLAPSIIADIGQAFRKFPSERAGAGLGLSIVQRIMILHGGVVEGRNVGTHGALIELDFSACMREAGWSQTKAH